MSKLKAAQKKKFEQSRNDTLQYLRVICFHLRIRYNGCSLSFLLNNLSMLPQDTQIQVLDIKCLSSNLMEIQLTCRLSSKLWIFCTKVGSCAIAINSIPHDPPFHPHVQHF